MSGSIVISVDFELFSDTRAFQKLGRKWENGANGETGIERLLSLFEEYNVTSTFFVVARHAQSHKHLLQKIKDKGHEVASHSIEHSVLHKLNDKELEREIKSSKEILEDTVKEEIIGIRTPSFAMNERIVRCIVESGYKYDSSIVPCWSLPGWYGSPGAPRHPFSIQQVFPDVNSELIEFPVATNPVIRMPISGAWMRLFGVHYTMWGIKSLMKREGVPVLYVHPWEVDNLVHIEGIPWRVYYRTGEKTLNMIKHIIENVDANFISIKNLLAQTA